MSVWEKDRKVLLLQPLPLHTSFTGSSVSLTFCSSTSPLCSTSFVPLCFAFPACILYLAVLTHHNTGLLAPLGDPVGNALNKGLSPVGTAIGGITNGGYTKSKEMDKAAEEQQSIGGKEQNGQNPLGL